MTSPTKYELPASKASFDPTHEYGYLSLVATLAPIIYYEAQGDYQGTYYILLQHPTVQQRYGYLDVGYGSCSGCDTLQGIYMASDDPQEVAEEIRDFRDQLACDIHWDEARQMRAFLNREEDKWYYEDRASFQGWVTDFLDQRIAEDDERRELEEERLRKLARQEELKRQMQQEFLKTAGPFSYGDSDEAKGLLQIKPQVSSSREQDPLGHSERMSGIWQLLAKLEAELIELEGAPSGTPSYGD